MTIAFRGHVLFLLAIQIETSLSFPYAIPILFDSSNSLHRDRLYHPEQPSRITEIVKALNDEFIQQKSSLEGIPNSLITIRLIDVASVDESLLDKDFAFVKKDSVSREPFSDFELEYAKSILLQIHDESLVWQLEDKCSRAKEQQRMREGRSPLGFLGYLDPDTFCTTETFAVSLRTTASWIRATDLAVRTGHPAMVLTRPPGHHATRNSSNGFCIFNFAAASALHVLSQNNPNHHHHRVSILDWDVHYGQGVADIVQDYPNARYVSIHQTPAFPYMGQSHRIFGKHENIQTIPIVAETSWTSGYQEAFARALPFISSESWFPNVVIVCAGYDALDSDELASVSLQSSDFGTMTRLLRKHLQDTKPEGRDLPALILGLEGGYQLSPFAGGGNLQQAVVETIRGLEK